MKSENKILDLSFDFAIQIIELYKMLVEQKEFVISKQLLRSATSIGANIEEANAAQTKKDFISKMSIASKEARETKYWLRLLNKSQLVKLNYHSYLQSIEHIINILTKIVKTSQESLPPKHSTFNTQNST
jgi:four helix bundle protein